MANLRRISVSTVHDENSNIGLFVPYDTCRAHLFGDPGSWYDRGVEVAHGHTITNCKPTLDGGRRGGAERH